MARGDVHVFAAAELNSKKGTALNLGTDTIKMGIVTNATVPSVSTADPRWGAGGTTNFSSNQVATGTGYTGPITLTSVTYTQASGVNTFDAADTSIAQDATGFTNGYWGILYDDTDAGKHAFAYVDLGGPVGNQSGPINFTWNASGIFTETTT